LSAPQTAEVLLPAEHSEEVVVAIKPMTNASSPVGGILIDDLRVE
jgi:hypothetical protein